MTKRQQLEAQARKLGKEKRELGSRLGEISLMAADDRTEAIQAEAREAQERIIAINGEINTVEASLATMPAETFTGDPASREADVLRGQARGAAIVSIAAMAHLGRSAHDNGALAEYQQEFKLAANQLPVEFLAPDNAAPYKAALKAASGLTAAPTNVGTNEAPIEIGPFADGDFAYMGGQSPILDGGDAVYPEISTALDVGEGLTDATDRDETALTVGSELLAPTRYQASVKNLTAQQLRMPQMEPAIRALLQGGLREAYDHAGIAEMLTVTQQVAGAVWTYATYISRLVYDNVDGRFAREESDLRVLMGTDTMKHAAGLYRANETATSALADVRALVGGVRASVHIPAVAANKQDVLVAKGVGRRNAVGPIWRGVEILVDPYTGAGKGEVEIVGTLFAAFSVSRAAGFAREESQHA